MNGLSQAIGIGAQIRRNRLLDALARERLALSERGLGLQGMEYGLKARTAAEKRAEAKFKKWAPMATDEKSYQRFLKKMTPYMDEEDRDFMPGTYAEARPVLDQYREIEKPKYPQIGATRTIRRGTKRITQEHIGEGKWEEIGVGEAFAPAKVAPKEPMSRKELSNEIRRWTNLERQLEMGGIDNPMVAAMMATVPPDSPLAQAFQGQDVEELKGIARSNRQYWEREFEEIEIKRRYPNAKQDDRGWYVIRKGKKYRIRRVE